MSRLEYLRALVLVTSALGGLGAAGSSAARRLLPAWQGPRHVLVAAVVSLAVALTTLHVIGLAGWLRPLVTWATLVVASAAVVAWARRGTRSDVGDAPASPPIGPVARWVGLGVTVVVVGQWSGRVAQSYALGILDADSLAYHLPFAARFVQEATLTNAHLMNPDGPTTFQAGDADVLHALGMLLTGGDVLSPLVNLGWLALALLAAWCCGRAAGVAPACVVGTAALLSSSTFSSTQAGSAMSDVPAMALLLCAVALLLDGWPRPPALAVAGLAAGMAIAVKLTVAPAVAVLVVGVVVLGRRTARVVVSFAGPLLLAGSFWFLKNLALVGNPLPTTSVDVGPFELPSPEIELLDRYGFSIGHYLTDGRVWREWFLPGLDYALGRWWVVLFVLAASGAAATLARDRPIARVVGAAALLAAVAYVFMPTTAFGAPGEPVLFARNVRYVGPALLLGLVLLPRVAWLRSEGRQLALLAVLTATWVVSQLTSSGEPPWLTDHRRGSLAGAIGAVGVLALALRRPRLTTLGLAAAAAAIAGGGWRVQHDYAAARYANPGYTMHSPAWAWAQPLSDARIGYAGFFQQYPLYGRELTNHVQPVGLETDHHGFTRATSCREWRTEVERERYDYVVLAPPFTADEEPPVEDRWTRGSPGVREVLRAGPVAVYEVTGRLEPELCR